MEDEAILSNFDAKRQWISHSWLWICVLFCIISLYLWILAYLTSGRVGTIVAVLVWTLWWTKFVAGGGPALRRDVGLNVALRALGRVFILFGLAACWQWWTGHWLMDVGGKLEFHRGFVIIIWAPITEELAFRGFLLRKTILARSSHSSLIVMALSNGIFFALHHLWNLWTFPVHYVMLQLLVSLVSGFASAFHVLTFGDINSVVAIHMFNNLLAIFYDPATIAAQGGTNFVLLYVVALVFCNALWIRDTTHNS